MRLPPGVKIVEAFSPEWGEVEFLVEVKWWRLHIERFKRIWRWLSDGPGTKVRAHELDEAPVHRTRLS